MRLIRMAGYGAGLACLYTGIASLGLVCWVLRWLPVDPEDF